MRWRKLTLNQAGLPAATKDELKKIVIYHVTAENAAVCVTKVGHVNSLSIKKIKEKKEIEETEESYRWYFTKAYFRSSAMWCRLHPISILVWSDCMHVYQK